MPRFAVARRIGWGLGDQVLSSLTNVVLTLSVARVVSPTSFGVFATLIVASQVVLVVSRGVTTDPLTVRHSGDRTQEADAAARSALGSVVQLGLLVGGALCLLSLLLPVAARPPAFALALVLPGVLVQDAVRFVSITSGRPRTALLNDLLWAVLQVGGVAVLTVNGVVATEAFVAVWGGAGTFCGLVGLVQLRCRPALSRPLGWVRQHWGASRFYVAENALLNGTNLVNIALIGVVAGFAATAGLRGAVTLYGPLAVLSLGARAALTPELVRLARRSRRATYRASIATSVGFAAVGAAWGCLLLLLPDSAGEQLLGETWTTTRTVLVFMAVDSTVSLFTVGAFIGIRASGDARRGLVVRLTLLLPRLVAGVGGAAVAGAVGAAVAFACLAPLTLAVWTYHLRRAVLGSTTGTDQ